MRTKYSFALISLLLSNAAAQTPGTFIAVGKMITPRVYHAATLLLNGKVLIAGGQALVGGQYLASAELYDPDTETFTNTGDMTVPHHAATATLLPDGQVLIVGFGLGCCSSPATSAEIYDPSTGAFTAEGNFASTNMNCNAPALLSNGKVLVNIGTVWPGPSVLGIPAELYDPAGGTFAAANGYSDIPHKSLFPCPLTTSLPDGKVLTTWDDAPQAELYDPDTASFRLTRGWMSNDYGPWTATLLTTGKVLITGETAAELYDPKTETFAVTGAPPFYHTATLLPDGTVLLVGGCHDSSCDSFSAGAELFDPNSGTFTVKGGMTPPRSWHTATLLRDGTVLIAGGVVSVSGWVPIAAAEIYHPSVAMAPPVLLSLSADGHRRDPARWNVSDRLGYGPRGCWRVPVHLPHWVV